MTYESYNLRLGDQTVNAVLIDWLGHNIGIFRLYGIIGRFKSGDVIQIDMTTLEAELYKDLVEREAV